MPFRARRESLALGSPFPKERRDPCPCARPSCSREKSALCHYHVEREERALPSALLIQRGGEILAIELCLPCLDGMEESFALYYCLPESLPLLQEEDKALPSAFLFYRGDETAMHSAFLSSREEEKAPHDHVEREERALPSALPCQRGGEILALALCLPCLERRGGELCPLPFSSTKPSSSVEEEKALPSAFLFSRDKRK